MSAQTGASGSGGLGAARGAAAAWRGASVATRVALVLGGVAIAIAALAAWPALLALIGPRVTVPEREAAQAPSEVAGQFTQLRAEIDGRSLFIVPGPPVEADPEPAPVADTTPREAPKPTTYGGPSIVAMVNDTVWFRDGKRLVAGAEASGDLSVVRVNGPWDALVMWKGVEFTVPLFGRDKLVLKDGPKATELATAKLPGPGATEPAKPADESAPDQTPSDQTPSNEKPTDTEPEKPASEDGGGVESPKPTEPVVEPAKEPAPTSGGR
jgi:hypothetical protein